MSRDQHVDDLAVLVDRAIDVAPYACDLDVRLIGKPASPDGVAAWSRRVDEQRREALHPAEKRDVIDVDAPLGKELLEVSVRQPEAQIPTHRQQDHLRREPEAHEH